MGVVVMATQYNSNNPAFNTRQQMELYQGSMSVKPSLSACHYVECRRNLTPYQTLYIRANQHFLNDPVLGPLQNYDVGQFTIATCNTNSGVLGELWVKYDVTLKKPKLSLINQPFLSAMDFGLPATGTTPVLPASATQPLLGFVGFGEMWTTPVVTKYFEDAPSLPIATSQPNNLRQVGCDYVPVFGGTFNNSYVRFPDEAPIGTTLMLSFSFQLQITTSYNWSPPAVVQAAVWPPAGGTFVGCDLLHHNMSSTFLYAGPLIAEFSIVLIFRRASSATAGVNKPWGWCPGPYTGTPVACVCNGKSFSLTYIQTGLPAGTTGLPVGTALW